MTHSKRQKGFTLIELLIVIAIIAIGSAIAAPSIISYRANFQLRAAATDLHIAFKKTRGEAVKRGRDCVIAFNQNIGGQIFDYIIFVDNSEPPNQVFDAADDLILERVRFAERTPGISLVANFPPTDSVAYTSRGVPRVLNIGNVVVQLAGNGRSRRIVMNATGGTRIEDI